MQSGPALADVIRTAWQQGQALALLKPSTPAGYRRRIVQQFRPHTLVTETAGGHREVTVLAAPGEHPQPVEDGSITVFTSGTTGPPKGVVIPRAALVGNARKTAALHGMGQGRPHGTCLALFHVNALVMSLLGTELTGERLILGPADPAEYFAALRAGGARTASVNPVVLRRIVDAAPEWPDGLDYLITAAGPCSTGLSRDFYKRYGPRLRQVYGMSEAVNFSFVMPLLDAAGFARHYLRGRPPIGVPLPDTTFRIEDDELHLRTPDLMLGYLGDLPSPVVGGWLRTGDCATVRDGMVVLGGRRSDALSTPSGRVMPADVEDRLALPSTCGEYAIVAVPVGGAAADRAALYLSGDWATEISDWVLAGEGPRPCLVQTNRIMLSGSGKVQRYLMGAESALFIGRLTEHLRSSGDAAGEPLAAAVREFLRPERDAELVVRLERSAPSRGLLAGWTATELTARGLARIPTPRGEYTVLWGTRQDRPA
jgi:acyl-CoA synthetase (AMP-forming)/AMP-acid ligase II